jgi:hypothetical protein
MEKYLNLFFFCVYRARYRMQLFLGKPFMLLYKLPFVKRRFAKKGVDPQKTVNEIFAGDSEHHAGAFVGGVLFLFIFAIVNIFIGLFCPGTVLSMKHFIVMGIPPLAIGYFNVYRNDKYIQYFDEFEKLPNSEIRKYSWLSFAVIVFVAGLWMFGLRLALPPKTP